MKKLLFLLLFPVTAFSADVTVLWDPYPTPDNHDIQVYCRVGDTEHEWRANVPAAESSRTVTLEAVPGDTVACQLRARHMVGDDMTAWPKSEFTAEAVATIPLADPTTPTGVRIEVE